jgi:RNA polymerase sigma factor (sigma-70 family)
VAVAERHDAVPYALHRDYVLAVLRRRCGWLRPDDCEAAYHDAYVVMLEKGRDGRLDADAMHPQQVRAYLTQTAIHKALDEGKRAERKRSEPIGERALAELDGGGALDELAESSLDSARVREIVAELPERQQAIVKLRFYFDRTPGEIQQYLDITERAYRRELERALRHVAERYELVREGRFCESRRSVILAYVGGFAGPSRAVEARNHLATCPGCAHWAAELREATQRGAALLPTPALLGERGELGRIGEAAAALREAIADMAGSAKQHALSLVARADPSAAGYATAVRPGAVAAAVAGCVALAGGTTYCVVEGVPQPLRSILRPADGEPKRAERPKPKAPRTSATVQPQRTPTPRAVVATPTPTERASRRREPARRSPTPVPTAPPAPVQEFGLEGSGEPATSGGGTPSNSPPASTAPSAAPPGEFDP